MPEKQTRRRGVALDQAILDAAWGELAERGWSGFTIEGIAARSGTAKAVIYRRWRNRVDLVHDMLRRSASRANNEFESSGDLRTDLVGFLRAMSEFLASPFGEAVRGSLCEGDLTTQQSLFGEAPIVRDVVEIVECAQARGELAGTPSVLSMNLGHGLVMSEFLHTGSPPPDDGLSEFVDTIWLPSLRVDRTVPAEV
jgi:AcrR family transcriptional regulator